MMQEEDKSEGWQADLAGNFRHDWETCEWNREEICPAVFHAETPLTSEENSTLVEYLEKVVGLDNIGSSGNNGAYTTCWYMRTVVINDIGTNIFPTGDDESVPLLEKVGSVLVCVVKTPQVWSCKKKLSMYPL